MEAPTTAESHYSLGFSLKYKGEFDKAIKAFQKSVHLPADGFPSSGLLERLRDNGSSQ